VELRGRHARGATLVDWDGRLGQAPNANIVLEVEQGRFEALVAAGLGAGPSRGLHGQRTAG
jgi:purine nucleosidase